jgi:hypothetical protein
LPDRLLLSNGLTALVTTLKDPLMASVLDACQKSGFHFVTSHSERFLALTIQFPDDEVSFIYVNWIERPSSFSRTIKKLLKANKLKFLEEATFIIYEGRAFLPDTRQSEMFASAVQRKTSPKILVLLG